MRLLVVIAAAVAACATPALAQAYPQTRDCALDPETTGSLAADPRSVYLPGHHPVQAEQDPPEVSWQAEARESSDQRQRELLACDVD